MEQHLNALLDADKHAFRHASKQITSKSFLYNGKTYGEDHKQVSQFRPHAKALSLFLGIFWTVAYCARWPLTQLRFEGLSSMHSAEACG